MLQPTYVGGPLITIVIRVIGLVHVEITTAGHHTFCHTIFTLIK